MWIRRPTTPRSGFYRNKRSPEDLGYSYDTNTLVMEMIDLSDNGTENAKLPVIWYANASGYQYNSWYNIQLMTDAIGQAFEQSPYIQSNK